MQTNEKTGCPNCDEVQKRTHSNTVLCERCYIDYLESTAYAAMTDYRDAVNAYIEKLQKEKKE